MRDINSPIVNLKSLKEFRVMLGCKFKTISTETIVKEEDKDIQKTSVK